MNYMSWKRYLDSRIDLKPIELSGRGRRFNDPLYCSADEAVKDIFDKITDELDGTPYAVFGHSMGTVLTYELIRKIIGQMKQEPTHVFFSGRYPPYVEVEKESIHMLPEKEFIEEINKFGGTNQELFDSKELLELFLPVLRSDYKVVEMYKHNGSILKLNCDITVLNGKYDSYINMKDVRRWQECTNKTCTFYEFEEGHFFINKYKEDVIDIINKALLYS